MIGETTKKNDTGNQMKYNDNKWSHKAKKVKDYQSLRVFKSGVIIFYEAVSYELNCEARLPNTTNANQDHTVNVRHRKIAKC